MPCKSDVSDFGGSNPPPPTSKEKRQKRAKIAQNCRFFLCFLRKTNRKQTFRIFGECKKNALVPKKSQKKSAVLLIFSPIPLLKANFYFKLIFLGPKLFPHRSFIFPDIWKNKRNYDISFSTNHLLPSWYNSRVCP